jgi:acyl dehydratase
MSDAGTITDDGLTRLRARVGIPEPHTAPPRFLRVDTDAFRHVAECYGDDNPLWCDPDYAAATRWGGSIAPPPLVGGDSLIGEDEVVEVAAEHRDLMKGDPLRGVHAFYAASAREWWAPLTPGTRVWRRNALVAALDKASEFAGRAVHEWTAHVFRADDGPLLSAQLRDMVRTERAKARERKKEVAVEPQQWSETELAVIDAQYALEAPRGSDPRWWEDVAEGDELTPIVKGPLTVTDMVCWHTGMGMGMYHVRPLRLAWRNRMRIPRFYHRDDLGIPDVLQRVHWDPAYARKSGNPTTFDYGRMRETWLIHLCTDWMGDDAWLWRLDCEFRKFNYVGDAHWMRGHVTRKYLAEGDRHAVDLDIWGENQRGQITTPGHATVLLPSRDHGPVRLPDPPGGATDLQGALDAIAVRYAEEG